MRTIISISPWELLSMSQFSIEFCLRSKFCSPQRILVLLMASTKCIQPIWQIRCRRNFLHLNGWKFPTKVSEPKLCHFSTNWFSHRWSSSWCTHIDRELSVHLHLHRTNHLNHHCLNFLPCWCLHKHRPRKYFKLFQWLRPRNDAHCSNEYENDSTWNQSL